MAEPKTEVEGSEPFRYPSETPGYLRLRLRTRVEVFKGTDIWHEVFVDKWSSVLETAILLCDLWEKHWCVAASERVDKMVPRVNSVICAARNLGVQIIHCPSGTVDRYSDTIYRKRIQNAPRAALPPALSLNSPPLPFSDFDDGCESGDGSYDPGTQQHSGITIAGNDLISDDGEEIYSLLRRRALRHLIIMGVHTNVCVMNRSFGIKQMTNLGVRCTLVRDLTDAWYNPRNPPYVSNENATELVVQYIEKYWCPSVLSNDLVTSFKSTYQAEPVPDAE